MPANVCCVLDCPAKQLPGEDLTYFSLPVGRERRLQWLKLIGRPDLYQDNKNYVICSIHFDSSQINIQRHVLPNVVPTRHIPKLRKGVLIYSSNTGTQIDFPSDDDESIPGSKRKIDDDTDKVVVYKRLTPNRKIFACLEIDDYIKLPDIDPIVDIPSSSISCSRYSPRDSIELGNRKIFVFSEETEEIAKTSDEPTVSNEVNSNSNKSGDDIVISNVFTLNAKENALFKKFNEWRYRTTDRRKGSKYERVFKIFALNLHSINTRAYRLLTESWQLPKERELMEIHLNVTPKFDERVTNLLMQKFKSLSIKEKYCTLGIYVVPLKPHLFYDPANDDLIGVHNVNGQKKREAAKYAIVAMVRGLKIPWCQPVAYSLISTMTDVDDIDVFVTTVVVKLRNMGLKILGVVMADNTVFWSYCRTKHFISVLKPYLNINKETVFVIFDVPHVLNLFKNEFIKNNFMFENKIVSWSYIKQVYEVDKERGGRLLPNLSQKHMKAGRDKSIKNPCQVLNRTVSGAISFYINHGLLPAEAAPTAELIKRINDVFDVLNANRTTKGIRNNETPSKLVSAQAKAIENANSIFKKLAKVVKDERSQGPDSLKYFQITFKALLYISLALKDASQIGLAQTSLSYLEPLLEFIKTIKGDNKRPTAVHFTKSFSKLFLKYLIELTPSPTSIGKMESFLKMADGVKDSYETYGGQRIYIKDKEYRFCLPEVYAIIYVSSFLLYKCSEKHMCKAFEQFLNRLVDLKKTKVYVYFEEFNRDAVFYDILKFPPIELPAYVERLDDCFLKCFKDFYHTNPAEGIYSALTNVAPWDPPCPCFPFDYMLQLFVRTRMYETVLHNTKYLKNKSFEIPYTVEAKKL